jgi:hypothetical protein
MKAEGFAEMLANFKKTTSQKIEQDGNVHNPRYENFRSLQLTVNPYK